MRVLLATALIAAVASGAEIYYAQKPSDWRDVAADKAVVAAATGKSNGNGNVNGKGNGGNGLHNGWNTGNNKDTENIKKDPGVSSSNGNGNVNGNGNGGNGLHVGWKGDDGKEVSSGNQATGVSNGNGSGHSKGNGNVNGNGNGGNGNHLGWNKDEAKVVDTGMGAPGQGVGNGKDNGHSNGNGNVNGNGNGGNGNHFGWKGDDTKTTGSGKENTGQGVSNGNGNGHSNGNGNVNGNGNGGNGNHLGWIKADVEDSGKGSPDQGVGNANGNGNSNGNGNVNGKGNGGNGVGNGNVDGHSNGNGNVNGNGNGGNGNHLGWNKDNSNVVVSGKENPGQGVNNGNSNGHSNGNGNVNGNGNGGNGNHFGWGKDDNKVVDNGKGTTVSAATTKRPTITVTDPLSTNPEIKVVSSTTAKPTVATPEKSTVAATTTKATPPPTEKRTTAAITKATPPPAEKSSTAAVTKAAVPPAKGDSGQDKWKGKGSGEKDKHNNNGQDKWKGKDSGEKEQHKNSGQDKWKGKDSGEKDKHKNNSQDKWKGKDSGEKDKHKNSGQDKWKGKGSGEKDKHNSSGQDKWKGRDSGEKDKHNGNGHDKLKGTTQQATTTKRPIITVRQPSSTEPAIKVASSTTVKPTSPTPGKSTAASATVKATPPPVEKSSTVAATKPAVKPPKDHSGQDKWKGKDSGEKDKHKNSGQDKWKGKGSGEKDKHNSSGQDKWKGRDSGEKDKHNGNGHDKFKGTTQQATTTKRPIITVRQPSSTEPAIKVASSTTVKPTSPIPEKSSAAPTTAKATPPPTEKSSTAAVTKPAVKPPKDHSGQDKWKGKDSGEKDKHNSSGQDKWKGSGSGEKDKHNGNGHDKFKGTTQQATTTKRPIVTVRQPSSTEPAIKVASSTTVKLTSPTPEKSTIASTTVKATPSPVEKSSTAAVTKPAVKPPKDNSGQDKWKGKDSAEKDKHNGNGHDKWKGKDSVEKDKHNNSGEDKWKGRDSGDKDKHNGNGHDKFKGTTQQATTTKRPIVTVRQPSSTEPAIKVASSTTVKPTLPTTEQSTATSTTAKATPPPAEKSSTAAVTKPVVKQPEDNSGQEQWKDHSGHRVDQPSGTLPAVLTDTPKQGATETTAQASTTRRPLFTLRLPSSTARVNSVVSSTTKPTAQTPGTTTMSPTTAKATVPSAEKTSPATSTKPAIATASLKSTLAEIKTSATTAPKAITTTETKSSTTTATSQKPATDPITPTSADGISALLSTKTTPVLRTVSSGSVPTNPPSTCNIYPTSPTATPRPIPPNFDSDSCTRNGYLHRLVLNSCCSLYMHQGADGLMKLRECATGTRFDVYSCSCRDSDEVTCFDRLPSLPTTAAKPTDATPVEKIVPPVRIGDMCVSNKNVYRVVENSGCAKFTQQGEDSHVVSHNCPAGTNFDLEVCTCRHAFEFQCSDKTVETVRTTPASTPSWPAQPQQRPTDPPMRIGDLCIGHGKAFGIVPRTGCTKFTQQTPDGRIFELNCPQGLKFDIDICVCRYETDFTCPDKTPSMHVTGRPAQSFTEKSVSKVPPTRVGDECHYMGSVYRLVTQSGCARFTQLGEDGRLHIHECPAGLLFNLNSCSCAYAEDIKCSDKVAIATQRPTDASATRVTQLVQGNTCIVSGNVYAVLPGTGCTLFTQEVAGARPFVHRCPSGLGFDLKSCVCRYFDEEFSCGDKVNGHLSPTTSGPLPSIEIDYPRRVGDTCVSAGNIYTVLPGSWCSKFTQEVTGGQKFIHSCPAGLGFDLDVCVCRLYDDQFSCGGKINVPVIQTIKPSPAVVRSTPSTSRIGDACISHDNTYRLAPKEGCRWFTQTSADGKMLLHHCPEGLKFDLDVCVCRFSSDFVCLEEDTVKVAPTTVAPKTTTIKATTALARSGDSCFLNGATYRLLPYCGCSRYTQRRPSSGGDELSLHECSAGYLFDLDTCACRPSGTFACTDPNPAKIVNIPVSSPTRSTFVTTAMPTAAVSSRTCVAGGNVFRIVRNTSCRRFNQEAPGGRVFENTCPGGLVFDMNLCICRYAHDVTCYDY